MLAKFGSGFMLQIHKVANYRYGSYLDLYSQHCFQHQVLFTHYSWVAGAAHF